MKRVFVLTIFLWTILSALVGIVRIIIISRPLPDSLQTLQLDTCQLPCWIGIYPGKTTVDEARTLIEQTFTPIAYNLTEAQSYAQVRTRNEQSKTYRLSRFTIMYPYSETFNADIYSKDGIVQQVGFSIPVPNNFPDITPTLDEIIQVYGLPSCVYFYTADRGDGFFAYYLNGGTSTYKTFHFRISKTFGFGSSPFYPINPPMDEFMSNSDAPRCLDPTYLDMALLKHYLQ